MHPSLPRHSPAALGTTVRAADADIATQLRYLVRSAEPAVVFSSLAHLCVPMFSDACIIDVVEHGEIAYRIAHYRSDLDPAEVSVDVSSQWSVCTPFASTATGNPDASYAGVITHQWRFRRITLGDRARAAVLARHCVAVVSEERHLEQPRRGHDTVKQLHAARAHRPLASVTPLGRRGSARGRTR